MKNISGAKLTYIAATAAIAISKEFDNADTNILSSFFSSIGDNLGIIAAQQDALSNAISDSKNSSLDNSNSDNKNNASDNSNSDNKNKSSDNSNSDNTNNTSNNSNSNNNIDTNKDSGNDEITEERFI